MKKYDTEEDIVNALKEFDFIHGKDSDEYKQTMLVLMILATRKIELRTVYKKYKVHERHSKLLKYFKQTYPKFNYYAVRNEMNKAGFIEENLLFVSIFALPIIIGIIFAIIIYIFFSAVYIAVLIALLVLTIVILLCWTDTHMESNVFFWLK